MPGASLWLVAPGTPPSPFDCAHFGGGGRAAPPPPLPTRLQTLIAGTLPAAHPGLAGEAPPFVPHLTLTSGVDPARYGADPQAWLDALPLARPAPPRVRFGPLATADAFVRRAAIAVARPGVAPLARAARAAAVGEGDAEGGVEAWLRAWEPHVSLV